MDSEWFVIMGPYWTQKMGYFMAYAVNFPLVVEHSDGKMAENGYGNHASIIYKSLVVHMAV